MAMQKANSYSAATIPARSAVSATITTRQIAPPTQLNTVEPNSLPHIIDPAPSEDSRWLSQVRPWISPTTLCAALRVPQITTTIANSQRATVPGPAKPSVNAAAKKASAKSAQSTIRRSGVNSSQALRWNSGFIGPAPPG